MPIPLRGAHCKKHADVAGRDGGNRAYNVQHELQVVAVSLHGCRNPFPSPSACTLTLRKDSPGKQSHNVSQCVSCTVLAEFTESQEGMAATVPLDAMTSTIFNACTVAAICTHRNIGER